MATPPCHTWGWIQYPLPAKWFRLFKAIAKFPPHNFTPYQHLVATHRVIFAIAFSHFFFPLISRPTRFSSNSSILIDNIFTNHPVNASNAGIIISDLSDHLPVFYILDKKLYSKKNKYVFTEYRELNKPANIRNFTNKLLQHDWSLNWFESAIPKVRYPEGPLSRRSAIPRVRCPEGPPPPSRISGITVTLVVVCNSTIVTLFGV